jgi:hypothetical protein
MRAGDLSAAFSLRYANAHMLHAQAYAEEWLNSQALARSFVR